MLSNDKLTREAAKFKSDSTKRFDAALTALLALAWQYKHLGGDFSFSADPELYAKALAICRDMSDGCLKDAENHIKSLFEEEFEAGYVNGEDAIERFDMAGSHLLELLNLWIALAFINGYSQAYTKISIGRWMNNPFASGLFCSWGKDVLKWGRGYDKNLINRLAVIGQNLIIDAARKREWEQEKEKGATYYIRRRGSGYDCPDCDELCGFPIPIEVPFERLHARCCCWAEYHYDDMPGTEDEFKERREEYERLKKDPNYKDVEFNPKNGGLRADHVGHNFDKRGGKYEKHAQNAGYNAGHAVIFGDERTKSSVHTEGTWDGKPFEVSGRETATSSNILKGLKHCASKIDTRIAVLDFPNGGFDEQIFNDALNRYKGLEKLNDLQFKWFDEIICVQGEEIIFRTTIKK